MDSTKFVASCAAAFGAIALIGCLVVAPILKADIQTIQDELDAEMLNFKVNWKELRK